MVEPMEMLEANAEILQKAETELIKSDTIWNNNSEDMLTSMRVNFYEIAGSIAIYKTINDEPEKESYRKKIEGNIFDLAVTCLIAYIYVKFKKIHF